MPALMIRQILVWLGLAALLAALAAPAQAAQAEAPTTPAPAIPASPAGERLELILGWINGADIDDLESVFSDEFLEAVPPPMLNTVRAQVFGQAETSLLRLDAVEQDGALLRTTIALAHDEKPTEYLTLLVGVDDDTRISTLLVQPGLGPESERPTTWEELDEALNELHGVVAAGAYELGGDPGKIRNQPIWERKGDHRLALGSAFKLWVLGAVGEAVARGELDWDTEIPVREDQKSLPSGQMQVHPDGTTFPLSEFATEMIRVSDNTATDHLIRLVGRDKVEAFMAKTGVDDARNTPFMTTKEMFQVKLGGNVEVRDRFAAAGEDERRAMLDEGGAVETLTPSVMLASAWLKPIHIDTVEWFASPRELADVMTTLLMMERTGPDEALGAALRQNPGLPFDTSVWTTIGFKGGSEPGVLNLTWQLERDDGRWFCLTFGWNDTESTVDMSQIQGSIFAAAKMLGEWDRD